MGEDPRVRRARELAPSLVGLREERAREVVAGHDGLWLRLVPAGAAVTLEFGVGRITATTSDGVVTEAHAG